MTIVSRPDVGLCEHECVGSLSLLAAVCSTPYAVRSSGSEFSGPRGCFNIVPLKMACRLLASCPRIDDRGVDVDEEPA